MPKENLKSDGAKERRKKLINKHSKHDKSRQGELLKRNSNQGIKEKN